MNILFSARSEMLQIGFLGQEYLLLYIGQVYVQGSCSQINFVK